MIEWLFQQSLVITFFVTSLRLLKGPIRRFIGAVGLYKVWCLLPLLVVISMIFLIYPPTDKFSVLTLISSSYTHSRQAISQYETPFMQMWTIGALIFICAIFLLHFRFTRMLSSASYSQDVCFSKNTATKQTTVAMYISQKVEQPLSVGILTSKIFVSDTFSQLPHEQRSLILEHEWVHCQRRDGLWNAIFLLTLCIFWFNPIMWWGYLCFRQEQELSCDSLVLKNKTVKTRAVYANTLLKHAFSANPMPFSAIRYGGRTRVKERILNIKSDTVLNKTLFPIIGATVVLLFLFTVVLLQSSHLNTHVKPIYRVPPDYPSQALELGLTGEVELRFSVETDGSVSDVEVVKHMGSSLFVNYAVSSFRLWVYEKPSSKIRNQRITIAFELAR